MQISEQYGIDPDKQTNNGQAGNPDEVLKRKLKGTPARVQEQIGTDLHIIDARLENGQSGINTVDANGKIIDAIGKIIHQADNARAAFIIESDSNLDPSKNPNLKLTCPDGDGSVTGDPHFKDMNEGYLYDVQGRNGGTYNIYSDLYFSINARFRAFGNSGATFMEEVGIVIDDLQISFGAGGNVKINGKEVTPEEAKELSKGKLLISGNTVKLNHHEVDFTFARHPGGHIDLAEAKVKGGVDKDGVLPHGLLGLSARPETHGRRPQDVIPGRPWGVQGQGVIDGNVSDYEVKDLFDSDFKYSQYYG